MATIGPSPREKPLSYPGPTPRTSGLLTGGSFLPVERLRPRRLAQARVVLGDDRPAALAGVTSRVTLGVTAGLVVGKMVGVAGAILLSTRLDLGELPPGVGRRHVVGMAALAGIGFTVSLFINGLAFDTARLADQAKIGVLAASLIAALVGAAILVSCGGWRWSGRAAPASRRSPAGSAS